MKKFLTILIVLLTTECYSQDSTIEVRFTNGKWEVIKGAQLGVKIVFDSVKATIIKTSEKTVVYKINGYRFVSFDCKCDSLKKGDVFMIPKQRFDSLLLEAKPIRKRDMEN